MNNLEAKLTGRALVGNLFHSVVWAHGFRALHDIVDFLSTQKGLEGLKVVKSRYRSHSSMIAEVYRADQVPLRHLSSKTKYLRKFQPEVYHLFFRLEKVTPSPGPSYQLARGIECIEANEIKWALRQEFNPRDSSGVITHDHVIHVSDSEAQAFGAARRVLGKSAETQLYGDSSLGIKLPGHLSPISSVEIHSVQLESVRISVLNRAGKVQTKRIADTPHFRAISGEGRPLYLEYITPFYGRELSDWYSWESFSRLAADIAIKGTTNPLIVRSRQEEFVVLDGAHRAAALLASGKREVIAAVV